jgi:hypothetical protein
MRRIGGKKMIKRFFVCGLVVLLCFSSMILLKMYEMVG